MEDEKENGASPQISDIEPSCSDQHMPDEESLGTISASSSRNSKVKTTELATVKKERRGKPMKRGKPNGKTEASTSLPKTETFARDSTSRRTGRVTKRKTRRSRKMQKRRPKRRPRVRYLSTETGSSGSYLSSSDGPCTSCGHHCCHLSYRECMGVGSSTLLSSPLLVKSYEPVAARDATNIEVTPEMIRAALKSLSMWRDGVTTDMILDYIMTNYPVSPNKKALLQDLEEKLRIAMITGIVSSTGRTWKLTAALHQRVSTTHVTRFWEVYNGEAMAPVRRKVPQNKPKDEKKQKRKL